MRTLVIGFSLGLGFLATSPAQGPAAFDISIGVRETGFAGSAVNTIGANGGTGGGIEWINLDGQSLPIDGAWHTFTFTFATDPVTGFAGTTANSLLEEYYGVLEHVRILNSSGVTDPITILIDDVVDTTNTLGSVVINDFELVGQGSAAMFQPPGFSGSTAANLNAGSNAVVETMFSVGSDADKFTFQFVDGTTTRWVRMTTFNGLNTPNPVVQFDDGSVITFRMMALTESLPDLGMQGPGAATAAMHGSGLNSNEASTFHAGGAPATTIGAVLVSFHPFPNLPILGGTIVSGGGYLFSIPMFTDSHGWASQSIVGNPLVVDFALQAVFYDPTQALQFTITNAVQVGFGQ